MLRSSYIDTYVFFVRLYFDAKAHCVIFIVLIRKLIRFFKDDLKYKSSGSVSGNAASHQLESLLVAKESYNGRS